jgi:hypothetical protein
MTEEAVKLPARCLLRSVTSAPSAACRSRECGYLGFPASSLSICWITVGGIGEKREDVDGQIATRDYLSLTVSRARPVVVRAQHEMSSDRHGAFRW